MLHSRAVKDVFEQRKEEIDNFFGLLYTIDKLGALLGTPDGVTERVSIQTYTSLKSSSILLLYNLVEAVVSIALEVIHDQICANLLPYTELNEELKELLLAYHIKAIDHKRSDYTSTVRHVKELIALSINSRKFELRYRDMTKFHALYSGNLDAKVIRKILSQYGANLEDFSSELKTIKDKRNSLAHGEESFEECGRSMSYEQLLALKDRSYRFIEGMMETVEDYLANSRFKATS